jgi:hypothetical protein
MTEDFLHHVWKYRLFNRTGLTTADGESLSVLHPGQHNHHAGPDFLDARIRIGDTVWAGPVEIHIRASDWHRHRHGGDERYHHLILHVVYEHDAEVFMKRPGDLPALHLAPYLDPGLWERYLALRGSATVIPCERQLHAVDALTWVHWKDRLAAERLEEKARAFLEAVTALRGDWEQAFYEQVARVMGFRVNESPFQRLAAAVPVNLIRRMRLDPHRAEAMLHGASGLLPDHPRDAYPAALREEFDYLRTVYRIEPLPAPVWNTGRIRPGNHPSLRIAQFAALASGADGLFSSVRDHRDAEELRELLCRPVHPYWRSHLRFDDPGGQREIRRSGSGNIGAQAFELLLINAVAVALAAYGLDVSNEESIDRAVKLFEFCDPEQNRLISLWKARGAEVRHAADSQALIRLSRGYCDRKACLNCMIGAKLIRAT